MTDETIDPIDDDEAVPAPAAARRRGLAVALIALAAVVLVTASAWGLALGPFGDDGTTASDASSPSNKPNPFVTSPGGTGSPASTGSSTDTSTSGPASAGRAVLTVDPSVAGPPFNTAMKGIALGNWTFTKNWNKPFIGEVVGLSQAVRAIDPGIIRYAGGLWANSVGFDRNSTQLTAYTEWTKNGNTYYFSYGTDELASLDAFAKSVNAEVMIQVNISSDDPAMWADLVRYAKERNLTSLRYYEFGNELDLETAKKEGTALEPKEYARRVVAYQAAMLAADPTIKLVGGVPATASDVIRNNWTTGGTDVSAYITSALAATRSAGRDLDFVSYHWYQTDSGSGGAEDVLQWSFDIPKDDKDFWKSAYSRSWSGLVAPWVATKALKDFPQVRQGISELGINSADDRITNSNHVGALWYSDVLGRLASTGVEWATQWDSYASPSEDFALIAPDSDQTTTPDLRLRPAYYAYLMYNEYFGDRLVKSTSPDEGRLSIWASTDTDDPGSLKLRVTNLTADAITVPITLGSFDAAAGGAYELTSKDPLDLSDDSNDASASTTINGVTLDGNNVAASVAKVQPKPVTVNGNTFTYTFPAYSSVAIVLRSK